MSRPVRRPRSARRLTRFITVLIAATAMVIGTVAPATVPAATASVSTAGDLARAASDHSHTGIAKTSLAGFNPGNIISDAVFTNKNTMTEAQIQSFFNSKVSKCVVGKDENGKPFVCLKDFKITSVNRQADAYCTGYQGAANETAARIIYKVSQACNINPQVLIVMLQKEQGLVTHVWPSAWRYNIALGQGCPDTAPCDPGYIGFFHQIYGAARQMQMYMEGKYFTWYAPGKTWGILWHPNASCGRGNVHIANKATSALYYYTPYQPNAAAMRAGYGEGDSCSSYGNRNFYNYFTDWFGSTSYSQFTAGGISVEGTFAPGQVLRAKAQFSPAPATVLYQWYRNGAVIKGATQQTYKVVAGDAGAKIDVIVFARKTGYQEATQRSNATVVRSITVERIAGNNREATAIAASRTSWPNGTDTVFLATSLDFADALSAAATTGKSAASLLLSPAGALPGDVAAELRRLAPSKVVLMGGDGVLSPRVARDVAAAVPNATVERLAGLDRYATSRAIVEWGGQNTSLFLASGRDFPDALSAASAGSTHGIPVLLIDGKASGLDSASVDTIRKIGVTSVSLVGGSAVVSDGIASHLSKLGITVKRLGGSDRYKTNEAVNNQYFPSASPKVLVAAGMDFPDALAGSALAGNWKVPLLLSERTCLPQSNAAFLQTHNTESVVLIGGTGVLSQDGAGQLRACNY